ncbi:MAG: amidohydrolase, partial [Pikeienuella sp.]
LFERVKKVAQGAAMMTETSVEIEVDKACSNLLRNTVLDEVMQAQMERIGSSGFSHEDMDFAGAIQKTLESGDIAAAFRMSGAAPEANPPALADRVLPMPAPEVMLPGSTDVGDVSWLTPLSQVMTASHALGTPFHSWQLVAQGKSGGAHRGLVFAAKTMAGSAAALFENPELLRRARDEFESRVAMTPYTCPIGAEVAPPFRR